MKERDIVRKILDAWEPGGWLKIPDSFGGGDKFRFNPKKDVDLVKVCDRCEVKIIKAKTLKGLAFSTDKHLRFEQEQILTKRNGLIAVGFVLKDWRGGKDGLVCIVYDRWESIKFYKRVTVSQWVDMVPWRKNEGITAGIIKGQAWDEIEKQSRPS